jgi:hypothetical protein
MPSSAEVLSILDGAPPAAVQSAGSVAQPPQPESNPFQEKMRMLDQAVSGKLEIKQTPSAMDKLLGRGTERYQTWPERVVRGVMDAAALPRDVMEEANTPRSEITDADVSTMSVPRVANLAVSSQMFMRTPGGQIIPTAPSSTSPPPVTPIPAAAPTPKPLTEGQMVSEAGKRIGVDLPRAVTSDSMGTQWAGKIASNIPFSGTPLRKASEAAIRGLDDAATRTQAEYGIGNVSTSGAAVREGITDYIKGTVADRKEILYNKVGELVDPTKSRTLTNTADIASEIMLKREGAAITAPSEAVKRVQEALERPGGLTYEGTKNLRTYIGEMLDGRSPLPADMSQGELKRIYGALSADLRAVAEVAGGDKALRAFERANKYAQLSSDRSEKLASILGAKSDEGIFDRMTAMAGSSSRANINLLRAARKSVDAASWDEYASGVISKLGRDAEGNFSPDRFVTAYGKLTPEAKSVLFKSTGRADAAQALDDIAVVSSRMKSLNKFANPSGTGQTVAGVGELHGMLYAPLSTLGSIVSGRVLSHILSKPQTVRATANWVKAAERQAVKPSAVNIASYRQASKALAIATGRELGRLDLSPQFLRQLNGAMPSAAEDQQPNR